MNIQITIGLASFAAGILASALWKMARRDVELQPGDIVLYTNPGSEDDKRNMITSVLHVFPEDGTAVIRYERTTALVRQRHLQVLDVDRKFPLLVPSKPCAEVAMPETKFHTLYLGEKIPSKSRGISSFGNCAGFKEVPLSWLGYKVGLNDKSELCVK